MTWYIKYSECFEILGMRRIQSIHGPHAADEYLPILAPIKNHPNRMSSRRITDASEPSFSHSEKMESSYNPAALSHWYVFILW